MRICNAYLEGIAPYSQPAQHETPKLDRESHDDYDERTWRAHATVNDQGIVCVPAMGLKQSVDSAAYKLGIKIPGRRGATYKNFFASGFICDGDMPLMAKNGAKGIPVTVDSLSMVKISANSDGVRGSGKRVFRRFPVIPQWSGTARFIVIDDILTPEIFEPAPPRRWIHRRHRQVPPGEGRLQWQVPGDFGSMGRR
jgi:hypothetical protein